jgi:N-acetylglucosaminyldiphosphoundecaprenol N-acetyl-beta-D-mannosaminyltransferase
LNEYPFGYILNSKITALNFNKIVAEIEKWIMNEEKNKYICVCNTHSLVTAAKDPGFNSVLKNANICTPDGMPLVWALYLNGYKKQERVDGPNLMLKLCETAVEKDYKIYLYGGTEEVLNKLERVLKELYKGINIVGSYSPPFKELNKEEIREIKQNINNAQPDITFVSLGCPKQEIWMNNYYQDLNSILIGVGAAFNFTIGDIKRPPFIFQKMGLEWFFRLVSEPKRLWKRYLYNNTVYIYKFIKSYRSNKTKTNIKRIN